MSTELTNETFKWNHPVSKSAHLIRIGISSCLLGKKVRFDSGHKRDRYLSDQLGKFVSFVPVCPEVEAGMGAPREAVRLVGDDPGLRMIGVRSGKDWTDRMNSYSRRRVKQKNLADLSGFILKCKSPSCGKERVKIYRENGQIERKGSGFFASALMKQFPDMPIEEESRLYDSEWRENFIERVFAYNRLQALFNRSFTYKAVTAFHSDHEFQLLAHSPERYRKLDRLVTQLREIKPSRFRDEYRKLFMQTLSFKATVNKHTRVLRRLLSFLRTHLSACEKKYVHETIDNYQRSSVPLIVPVTLLRFFIDKYDVEQIRNQYYLHPHPEELMLRNHA